MSIAEYGAPTERELGVLMIARAMRGIGFVIDGCIDESEVRAACRRLAERRLGDIFIGKAGETFRINSAGMRITNLPQNRGAS